jgi:hypothetical protein
MSIHHGAKGFHAQCAGASCSTIDQMRETTAAHSLTVWNRRFVGHGDGWREDEYLRDHELVALSLNLSEWRGCNGLNGDQKRLKNMKIKPSHILV